MTRDRSEKTALLQIKAESRGLVKHTLSLCKSAVCTAVVVEAQRSPMGQVAPLAAMP